MTFAYDVIVARECLLLGHLESLPSPMKRKLITTSLLLTAILSSPVVSRAFAEEKKTSRAELPANATSTEKPEIGSVAGTVTDQASGRPIEFAVIVLKDASGKSVQRAATDARGGFVIEAIPFGEYRIDYGLVGGDSQHEDGVSVDAQHRAVKLGLLTLTVDAVQMQKLEVSAKKEAFYNSIDRKTYNVGKELQSVNGSASDLLQNVPSVDVDIDGNVSLRGDSNVLILLDGRTSAMMGTNRAAVLQQMPADGIDKIEVITNPSAKYRPDGTAGIINIRLKKEQNLGYGGSIRATVGNDRRYNLGLTANYNPGKYNVFGSFNVRQDDRQRTSRDTRSHLDVATGQFLSTTQYTVEHQRPLSLVGQVGVDYRLSSEDKVGASVRYNHRRQVRNSNERDASYSSAGLVLTDYNRLRVDPETEKDLEFSANYHHAFAEEGRELNLDVKRGLSSENQHNDFSNVYLAPVAPTAFDRIFFTPRECNTELTAEYIHPLGNDAKIESGYELQVNHNDFNNYGANLDSSAGLWVTNAQLTNFFIYDQTVHAGYVTYAKDLGKFGFLAGLRLEDTLVDANQVTGNIRDKNDYFRAYPSLHLTYNLGDHHQLQVNYSHRVRRPENDDVNPYPVYVDPFNLRAGNPKLVPQETHSIEAGYQYKNGDTSYLATVYYRNSYHGFTQVTRYINSTTSLTTEENLAKSQSGGLEFAATRSLGPQLSINFSSNTAYNEINASNLGYGAKKSAFGFSAKLNANYHATKTDLFQLNSNYNARRLTPQGYRLPNFVANVGWRHDLADKKTALILTVSDVFNTQKDESTIDTPILHDDRIGRRSSRLVFMGVIYNFGKVGKKPKDEIPFDTGG